MSPTKDGMVTFRASAEMQAAMETLRERFGTPYSEQCRRALVAWLRAQGVLETREDTAVASRPQKKTAPPKKGA